MFFKCSVISEIPQILHCTWADIKAFSLDSENLALETFVFLFYSASKRCFIVFEFTIHLTQPRTGWHKEPKWWSIMCYICNLNFRYSPQPAAVWEIRLINASNIVDANYWSRMYSLLSGSMWQLQVIHWLLFCRAANNSAWNMLVKLTNEISGVSLKLREFMKGKFILI